MALESRVAARIAQPRRASALIYLKELDTAGEIAHVMKQACQTSPEAIVTKVELYSRNVAAQRSPRRPKLVSRRPIRRNNLSEESPRQPILMAWQLSVIIKKAIRHKYRYSPAM